MQEDEKIKINRAFNICCNAVKTLTTKPCDDDLLILYGYYKQATEGDCNKEKPSFFNFKECKKWESWKNQIGKDEYVMKSLYNKKVKELINNN